MKVKWVNSGGGPLIFCGMAAAAGWRGAHGSSVAAIATDYERACDLISYLHLLPSGSSHVLVLGDEPLQSTFIHTLRGPVIFRWVSCLSAGTAETAINDLPATLPSLEESLTLSLDESNVTLFDAAMSFEEASDKLSAQMPAGEYVVTTELYKTNRVFEFLVHRFVPAASPATSTTALMPTAP